LKIRKKFHDHKAKGKHLPKGKMENIPEETTIEKEEEGEKFKKI